MVGASGTLPRPSGGKENPMPDHPSNSDPLGLKAIDREIRINELEEQAKEMGMVASGAREDCPPEVRESFLKNMIDFENGPISTEAQRLKEDGVVLPKPGELSDAAIHEKLWQIIDAMARRSTYLHHTNHLSDRQLYDRLWSDTLLEETNTMPPNSGWRHHIDMIGGGSDE